LPDVVNEHNAHSLNIHVWSPIMVCTHPTFMAVTDHKVHSVFTDCTWLFGKCTPWSATTHGCLVSTPWTRHCKYYTPSRAKLCRVI